MCLSVTAFICLVEVCLDPNRGAASNSQGGSTVRQSLTALFGGRAARMPPYNLGTVKTPDYDTTKSILDLPITHLPITMASSFSPREMERDRQ